MTRRIALAFAGGCAGGALRIAIDAAWPDGATVPWALVLINLVGSFAIGIVGVVWGGQRHWWPLLGPGVLGGFTTFSAIAAMRWTTDSGLAASLIVLAASLIVCPLAARLGVTAAERSRQASA